MNNNVWLFALAVLVAAGAVSCKEKSRDFSADLDLQGISSPMASITVFGMKDSVSLDVDNPERPAVPVVDGKFHIGGTAAEPVVLRVSFSGDKRFFKYAGRGYFPNKASSLWFVASPGMKLSVSGDLTDKNFVDLYPKGDRENDLFAKLSSALFPLQSRQGDISVILATDSTLTEARKHELEAESDRIEGECSQIRHDFVSGNPSSVAALWLMEDMLIRRQMETSEMEPILEKVSPKYRDNYFYRTVFNRVQGAKASAVGQSCPRLEGTDVTGSHFDIKDLRGKYVLIDFWGTWCGPCIAGMPAMKAFRDAHADKLQIVGVAQGSPEDQWRKFIADRGIDWPNIRNGEVEDNFVAAFNVQGYPTKILVGPDGTILFRHTGENEEFYGELAKMLE